MEANATRDKYDQLRLKAQDKLKSETNDLQKIIVGKSTMKSMFSRKSKEDEISVLEKQIVKVSIYHKNIKLT